MEFLVQTGIGGILTPAGSLPAAATAPPVRSRSAHYVTGLIGIIILWFGPGQIFPRDEALISYILRYFRDSLVVFWVIAGAPWLFFHFKLAQRPNR
jgi:hypothetical protein